jgi:hypothetical protein
MSIGEESGSFAGMRTDLELKLAARARERAARVRSSRSTRAGTSWSATFAWSGVKSSSPEAVGGEGVRDAA